MNDETQMLSFFDCPSNSRLHNYSEPLDKIKIMLSKFGLTQNECKVFIFLGKYGPKTGGEACKILNLPRTETYKLLSHLQSKGIVTATFDHPIMFSALPIENAIDALVKLEMQHVKALHIQKSEIVDLWDSLPTFQRHIDDMPKEKFQILKGSHSIMNVVNDFILNANNKLSILGPEKFFMKIYHSDSLDVVQKSAIDIQILTSCSENAMFIFEKIPYDKIRKISSEIQNNLCFVVKDNSELLAFIKNDVSNPQDMMAIRTDSITMVYTMTLLFNQIWSNSKFCDPDNPEPGLVDNRYLTCKNASVS